MGEAALRVRAAVPADAEPLADLLNAIIAAGGTTALEVPFTADALAAAWILPRARLVSCQVVLDPADGVPAGFQLLDRIDGLPDGWADIGTFTRRARRIPGAGRALMQATLPLARAAGVRTINATIRADNVGGLAFYRRMGFVRHGETRGVPLADGTPVDRLHHRLDLIAD